MAEIGVVRFAQVAREVAEAVLPRYRTPFSKHTFTQPTLLAILCVMRYEDWTYREAEGRLREPAELRAMLGIDRVPDSTTLYRCLRRTGEEELTQLLHETIRRLPPAPEEGTTVAVDGTGLAPGAISTFFVNRVRDRGEGFTWCHWLKWVVVVDLPRPIILAQAAKRGSTNDGPTLRPLLDCARNLAPIRCVLADGEFDSELNHAFIRQVVGGDSIIPAYLAQARQADLASAWRACTDARRVPRRALSPAGAHWVGRLGGQMQALGAGRWAVVRHPATAGAAGGHRLQRLPPPFASPARLALGLRMSTGPDGFYAYASPPAQHRMQQPAIASCFVGCLMKRVYWVE